MVGPGPEHGYPSEPQAAVAYLTPPNNGHPEALHAGSFFTPEHDGRVYDVNDPLDAAAYLTEVHGRDLPEIRGDLDASTGFHLAMAMRGEERAAIDLLGRPQNVAEHSFNLAITSSWTALAERPDLDGNKVTLMAVYHDAIVEAYGGDTVINDPEAMESKRYREAAGLTLFLQDAGDHPIAELMREYEAGLSPEARFVNGMDKVEAYQFSLATKAELHRQRGERFEEVVVQALPKAAIDPTAFEKMQAVLKQLGRKWNEWDCSPVEGDTDEIVDGVAKYLTDEVGEVFPFPYNGRIPATELQDARIFEFPPLEERPQPEEIGNVARMATVAHMEDWRQRRGDGSDPNPPGSPATIALAA